MKHQKLLMAVVVTPLAAPACFGEILYGPTHYTSASASSTFNNNESGWYAIGNVFDADISTQWASWANDVNGQNPQGNQEVWFSFALDKAYAIDAVVFAPRWITGLGDGISGLKVWISSVPLGVDVQDAGQTTAFLADRPLPTLVQYVNFEDPTVPQTYSLASPVVGQYFAVQLTTDFYDPNQNIGARQFVLSVVPEPSTYGIVLGGLALAAGIFRRRRALGA